MPTLTKNKIEKFTDLTAWQVAHKLAIDVYRLTEAFPEKEAFGLTNQTRRAVVSIGSNIAEGFGRQGQKEKVQFYSIARGSLLEVQSQLMLARDLKYLDVSNFSQLADQIIVCSKVLNGLIKSIRDAS